MKTEINACPHCGSTYGFYRRVYVSGWVRDCKLFNGEIENTGIYDYLKWSREAKEARCIECEKIIKGI